MLSDLENLESEIGYQFRDRELLHRPIEEVCVRIDDEDCLSFCHG